ncbi:MAG: hypothetical protein RBR53_01270 [Desulforegulaceae bacterium]|nr:hypothetical protein [Desulforegulaceae bacterium]
MTVISGINIVIQQGDIAKESQQLKSGHQDANQVAASAIPDKAVKQRTQVQQTPDTKKSEWEKERQREKDRRKAARVKKSEKNKKDPKRIVDTIA